MVRYSITGVNDRGRAYYVVSWPGERKRWDRGTTGRRQKKFAKKAEAEAFLEQIKRERTRNGEVRILGWDREAHYDFLRAHELLEDVPGASLTKAAELLRMARGVRELRGSGFVVPRERRIELSPRAFLVVQHRAREAGMKVNEMMDAIVLMWAEEEAERRVAARQADKDLERKLAERERERLNESWRVRNAERRERRRKERRADLAIIAANRKLEEAGRWLGV